MSGTRKPIAVNQGDADTPDIAGVVAELRRLRLTALERRRRTGRPPRLPSRRALLPILENISAALYPNRLGPGEITEEGVDFFVGHTLEAALRALTEQVNRELIFSAEQSNETVNHPERRAAEIIAAFATALPAIRSLLDTDIAAAYDGDPAARSIDEVLVCYPGITAITFHRVAHVLYNLGAPLVARIVAEIAHSSTGIDIHPGAKIGGSFFIDHGTGVVIGETAVIGERVRLYQAVTLGAKRFEVDSAGALVKGAERHPIVENDVVIYAGATILGRVTIGHGSTIGGNVWLTRSVPPNSYITQAHTRNDFFDGGAGI